MKYFEEIGWFDPFPNKNAVEAEESYLANVMNMSMQKLAYPSTSYFDDYCPSIIYLPSPALIKKIFKVFAEKNKSGAPRTIEEIMSAFGVNMEEKEEQ